MFAYLQEKLCISLQNVLQWTKCIGGVSLAVSNIDLKQVGFRIKEIRQNLGLSMSAFATKIDNKAKSGTVSNWETGKNLPNNERLKKIADLGNTTIKELLYGDERYYLEPIIINIAKNYYDWDISNDVDMINHIFNRLNYFSYDDDENSLIEKNKETFDRILLYPWEWNSEGIVHYSSIRIHELINELESIVYSNIDSFDDEMQKDIEFTTKNIEQILSKTKLDIENLDIDSRFSKETRINKEIDENANKEILDPKHD